MNQVMFQQALPAAGGFRDVEPSAVARAKGDALLVDVREPHEWSGELGHIPGARLVPLATLTEAAQAWPRHREVVVICRSGARSGRGAAALVGMGFTRVMNMKGGMLAYNEQQLPVERG